MRTALTTSHQSSKVDLRPLDKVKDFEFTLVTNDAKKLLGFLILEKFE